MVEEVLSQRTDQAAVDPASALVSVAVAVTPDEASAVGGSGAEPVGGADGTVGSLGSAVATTAVVEPGAGRKSVLLRLDPAVHIALSRWAADELHSVNSFIELLLRDELRRAGRLPRGLKPPRRPGRPASGSNPAEIGGSD